MKLLIVNDFGIIGGGTERRVKNLINFLFKQKKAEEIHLLLHKSKFNEELYKKEAHVSMKVHLCETKNSGAITEDIINNYDIDVVQVHNLSLLSTRPILAAKKFGKRIIFSAHDQWGYCGRRVLIDKNEQICSGPSIIKCIGCNGFKNFLNVQRNKFHLNKCDLGIAPSQFVADMYSKNKILSGKWKTILPWHPPESLNQNKRSNYILYVGSIKYYKGLPILLKAIQIVKIKLPNIVLKIAGADQDCNNEDRKKINSVIEDTGIQANVEFLGFKNWNEIKELMSHCYIFVMPSVCQESSSLSVVEAMFSGCAIIASKSGGVPEIVSEAAIVVQQNHPEKLAQAIIELFSNEKIAEEYRKKAYSRASNFFSLANMNKLIDLY